MTRPRETYALTRWVFLRGLGLVYRFTDASTRRATGTWWQRRPLGLYFPPASLRPAP